MKLQRIPYSGSTSSRIVHALGDKKGEDIARISGPQDKERSCIAYPDKLAQEIVRAVNGREALLKQLDEAHEELARRRATKAQLKPINLDAISRSSDRVFTHVRFDDYDLSEVLTQEQPSPGGGVIKRGLNWLEFGECCLSVENGYLGGRMGHGIKDFEHDTPYVVRIEVIGVKFKFADNHVSFFEAYLSPDPNEIRIYRPDFDPKQVETGWQCDDCAEAHWTLPDGYFSPPVYDLAHVVAGKRVTICMGPRWGDDE